MRLLSSIAAFCGAVAFFTFLILALTAANSVTLPGFIQSVLEFAFGLALVIGLLTAGPAFLVGRR